MRIIESFGAAAGETALYTICVQMFPQRIGFIVVSIYIIVNYSSKMYKQEL